MHSSTALGLHGAHPCSLPVLCMQDGSGSNTELVNVVYLDNSSLELYHSLLDKRPNAVTYRLTYVPTPTTLMYGIESFWRAPPPPRPSAASGIFSTVPRHSGALRAARPASRWKGASVPNYVALERVSHRPISAIVDSLPLPEASVVAFLKGQLRVGDITGTWRALVS